MEATSNTLFAKKKLLKAIEKRVKSKILSAVFACRDYR